MLHWRRIKVYARSVWDVIIIITAFCLANDGHLLFSAQWLQKPLGGSWWEVLTRGWLIYWASPPPSPNTELVLGFACFPLCLLLLPSLSLPYLPVLFVSVHYVHLHLFLHLHLYFEPTFTFPPHPRHSLHSRAFLLYVEAAVALREGMESRELWMKWSQKKNRNVLIFIDTQFMEAIKEL